MIVNRSIKLKKIVLLSSLLAFVLLLWIGFIILSKKGYFLNKNEQYFYRKLSIISKNNSDIVLLKEVTSFEWDYVCVISSYDQERPKYFYEKIVGFEFAGQVPESYGDSEGEALLLFINRKKAGSTLITADKLVTDRTGKICVGIDDATLKLKLSEVYNRGLFTFHHEFILE